MADDFSGIEAQVASTTGVEASAAALINGFQARLDEAIAANDAGDNSKLTQLSADLKASSDALAAAVANGAPSV